MRLLALPLLTFALAAQPPVPQEASIRAHLAFLADPLLEGRGTGQRGGRLAARYLAAQLQTLGVKPLAGQGYLQPVPLVGTRLVPAGTRLAFHGPEPTLEVPLGTEAVLGSGSTAPTLRLDAPVVFVGHGTALAGRDDFKGADLRGKLLLALVGDRPESRDGCCEPRHFAGRWTYKLAEARARGAAGILLVHRAQDAGYAWDVARASWEGERFQNADQAGGGLQGWVTEAFARRLLKAGGQDLDVLREAAERPDFKPLPLPLTLRGEATVEVRHVTEFNVAGVVPGRDQDLAQEALILSAHWDHLGKDPASGQVFPGAVDNATGCAAALALAKDLVLRPLRRSVILLFPAAEEPGLLGAQAYLSAPLWPLARTRAVLNLESLNVAGPTRDIGLAGSRGTPLEAPAAAAAARVGLRPTWPDRDPQGLFFRADHFAFVRAGIPAFSPGFSLDGGWDFLFPESAARARRFLAEGYHKPEDRYDPTWDLGGLLQQGAFVGELLRDLGDREVFPMPPSEQAPAFHPQ